MYQYCFIYFPLKHQEQIPSRKLTCLAGKSLFLIGHTSSIIFKWLFFSFFPLSLVSFRGFLVCKSPQHHTKVPSILRSTLPLFLGDFLGKVVITSDGCRVLTCVPRTVAEIEAVMAGAAWQVWMNGVLGGCDPPLRIRGFP